MAREDLRFPEVRASYRRPHDWKPTTKEEIRDVMLAALVELQHTDPHIAPTATERAEKIVDLFVPLPPLRIEMLYGSYYRYNPATDRIEVNRNGVWEPSKQFGVNEILSAKRYANEIMIMASLMDKPYEEEDDRVVDP